MTYTCYVTCSKCGDSKDIESCGRCERGHVVCNSCFDGGFFNVKAYKCPLCNTSLKPATDSVETAFDGLKKEVYKKTSKVTFWWWGYLFRNPDLVLSLLSWPITLVFLSAVRRNSSFGAIFLEWVEGSLIASIAPVLTLVFIQRKRAGLGLINGWRKVWSGDLKPIGLTVGIVSALFLIHLFIGK